MKKTKFKSDELVLVKIPVTKQPKSMGFDGYWPAKTIQKLRNGKRQVKLFASEKKVNVLIEDIMPYNQDSLKKYFSKTMLSNNSELALAVEQIESNYVAKHRTAEQLNLSGGGKLLELRSKDGGKLSGNKGGSKMMTLWKSHVERWQDRTPGIGHLSQTVKNFAMDNKEVIVTEFYQDFMLHLCTMEQANLLFSIDVKQVVDILVDQNDNLNKPNKIQEVEIDNVIPLLTSDDSNDNINSLLLPVGSCDDSSTNIGTSDITDIAATKDLSGNQINEEGGVEIVCGDDDLAEEMNIQEKEVDKNTTYNRNDNGSDIDDEVEFIEIVGNETFKDKIFEVGQKRKRSMEMMKNGNKRQNNSKDMINKHQDKNSDLVNAQDRRQFTGNCRCGRTNIDKYGIATRSTNENNKTVKISINYEMSTDAFVQMFKEIPQLMAKDASNPEVMVVNID